ncbi:DUF2087 domain-containing protein [Lachnoclostridium phytofermentans]|uniref:Regulatory protein, LuxR n=1 Tax=Lachnoclostridium phytofermentans (strain ATCC 700394 / DSM 18823 / ISDg) TaxID=357809 RepID=A9KRM3_LACP7|nr:DUF2087 domain-containing protein [Lachnoclostridium phytofermentans]ABX43517.1 regulatory protein, LuxR [Lachnoclostridium phytofermentans ISDg]
MDYKQQEEKVLVLLKNLMNKENHLIEYPAKRKLKNAALFWISKEFESGREYKEKEMNEIINSVCCFKDAALIRRELYNFRFINRTENGSAYWLEEVQPSLQELGLME